MNEIKTITALRQINDALNTRNNSSTISMHNLSLNLSVLMFREKTPGRTKVWTGPFNLFGLEDETTVIC